MEFHEGKGGWKEGDRMWFSSAGSPESASYVECHSPRLARWIVTNLPKRRARFVLALLRLTQ